MHGLLNRGTGVVGIGTARVSFLDTNESSGVTDTFTDDDSTALPSHTADSGEGWTEYGSGFQISSNTLVPDAGALGFSSLDAGEADIYMEITLRINSGTFAVGPAFRGDDVDNHFFWRAYYSPEKMELYERTSASYILRGQSSATIADDVDHTLTVITNDETITGYLNGANKVTYASASARKTVTTHGVYAGAGTDWYLDNLTINAYTGTEPLSI